MTVHQSQATHAFDTIYRSHHNWLVGLLRHKLGNIEQAADLAHDTFERILRSNTVSSLADNPRAYLTTVASRLAVSHFRRASLEHAYLEALAARPHAYEPSPEARALILDTLRQISELLEGLSPRTRRIFLLVQLHDISYKRAGEILGIPEKSVQKAMSQALVRCYSVLYA